MKRFAISIILSLLPAKAFGADFKPIELHPSYKHDKFKTQPRDIFRKFRAYVTRFDSGDDDNNNDCSGWKCRTNYSYPRCPKTGMSC